MKKSIIILLVLTLVILFTNNLFAIENRSFEINTDKLPPKYKGNDIQKVFLNISKISPKSDFESTDDYKKRISNINFSDFYSFKINKHFVKEYNADNKNLHIKLSLVPTYIIDEKTIGKSTDLTYIDIMEKSNSQSDYVGSNAFGVIKNVKKSTGDSYKLAIVNKIGSDSEIKFNISLEPDDAKLLFKNIGILMVGKIKPYGNPPKYTYESSTIVNPTLNNPVDVFSKNKFVCFELLEIWVYNYENGKIIKKIDYEKAINNIENKYSSDNDVDYDPVEKAKKDTEETRKQANKEINSNTEELIKNSESFKYLAIQLENAKLTVKNRQATAENLEKINSMIEKEPQNFIYLAIKGELYIKKGQINEGIILFDKSLDIAPDQPNKLTILSLKLIVLIEVGEINLAKKTIKDLNNFLPKETLNFISKKLGISEND